MRKVFNREGKLTTDPKQIMNESEVFYSDLYDGSTCVDMVSFSSFLSDLNEIPSLVEEKKNVCEGKLGYGECYNAFQTFQKNKSPGNDGLTVEFYLAFWPVFGSLSVQSLNYPFEYGELSNSQKQAVITLVEKRGKDKRQIKNGRPISLINVDAKIASKTLAKRLENVLHEIFHFDHSASVKGRTIFDAFRTIDDAIEHTMNRDRSGILVAIDFEKAFDSLNFNFLLRVLHAFNFGPSFIKWVRVLYNKAFSCVMNNGFTFL